MVTVQGHVIVKPELPAFATCAKCQRTFHPRDEEQLNSSLCDQCFERAKFPAEPVISVHVKPRPCRPEATLPS